MDKTKQNGFATETADKMQKSKKHFFSIEDRQRKEDGRMVRRLQAQFSLRA
jgi:hypothetical protein